MLVYKKILFKATDNNKQNNNYISSTTKTRPYKQRYSNINKVQKKK